MSLDVRLMYGDREVYSGNITHNLGTMAREAEVYQYIWRPEELKSNMLGRELIHPLYSALAVMLRNPARFKAFDAANGWGVYEDFTAFMAEYLAACIVFPDATVQVCR